ncbi:MAG: HEPN domain-containing protein [Armatimonadota bacterium]|jgi:HEPN domain-containing protein
MRQEAADTIADADHDLATARDMLAAGRWNWAVFCARQAVEKMLKCGYPVLRNERWPGTHNLAAMATECFPDMPEDVLGAVQKLMPFYASTRYANAAGGPPFKMFGQTIAEEAVAWATRATGWLRGRLGSTS